MADFKLKSSIFNLKVFKVFFFLTAHNITVKYSEICSIFLRGGVLLLSLHDCVYGVQYNMYSLFFSYLKSYIF